jgi:hypothetical protein
MQALNLVLMKLQKYLITKSLRADKNVSIFNIFVVARIPSASSELSRQLLACPKDRGFTFTG